VCAIRCPRQVRTEFIFVISPTGSRISTKARGLFTEEETPLVSLFQFNLLRALARERSARGPRRDHTTRKTLICVYCDLFSNKKQPHAAFTRPASLFSLGLHLSSGILCVRHWRGSARHLLERQTLETGVFDQDVCPAVKVHLRVRNILNSLFDSL